MTRKTRKPKQPKPNPRPAFDAMQYQWSGLHGLRDLLELTAGRKVMDRVELRRAEQARDWSFYGGDGYNYVEEAFIFDDGTILAAVSVTAFAGTFADHHDVKVLYYHLEPNEMRNL